MVKTHNEYNSNIIVNIMNLTYTVGCFSCRQKKEVGSHTYIFTVSWKIRKERIKNLVRTVKKKHIYGIIKKDIGR